MLAAAAVPGFDAEAARAVASLTGARYAEDAYGPQCLFDEDAQAVRAALAEGFVSPLTDLAVIMASGPDTRKFLQSQTTNDVDALGSEGAQWTGYCTPKGRLLATMLAWGETEEDAVGLVLSRSLLAPIHKRLSMYVLRAKVRLADEAGERVLIGLAGAGLARLSALGLSAPEPMRVQRNADLVAIGLEPLAADPDLGLEQPLARALLVLPTARLGELWPLLSSGVRPASSTLWRWTEVASGVARISEGTRELFVPQMLNFELVGGVSFTKGCYPGQEVVARSQYLGKLKRRSFRGHVADGDEPLPGTDVFAGPAAEPTGQVVLAAPAPGGGIDLLFEAQMAAVESARAGELELRAGSTDGPRIALAELPYALPA